MVSQSCVVDSLDDFQIYAPKKKLISKHTPNLPIFKIDLKRVFLLHFDLCVGKLEREKNDKEIVYKLITSEKSQNVEAVDRGQKLFTV